MYLVNTHSAWSRALRDPSLRDLPYKIETNEYGQLVMSPVKLRHGRYQSRIDVLLAEKMERAGEGAVEVGIATRKGVKAPDVVWGSEEFWKQVPIDAQASPIAPEICIEVLSESNTTAEIDEKRSLYFECGAREFWTCDLRGRVRFFDPSGEQPASDLVPAFPAEIDG